VDIRPLTASDAEAFQRLRLAGLRECPEAFASSYEEERDISLEELSGRLVPEATHCVLGAFRDAQLVGILGFQCESKRKTAHKAFIWGMYVTPAQRRKGIGRRLLATALEMADSLPSIQLVTITVNSSNVPAVALYENIGFKTYGVEPGALLVNGQLYDETQMFQRIRSGT